MDIRDAIEIFHNYSSQEKIDFLTGLSYSLTILARDTYEVGGDGLVEPARLRIINEIQHQLTHFLIALAKDSRERYPDDVLVEIILEHPEDVELQRQIRETFDHLSEQITTAV